MLSVFMTGSEIQAVSGSVLGRKYRVNRVWRQELPEDVHTITFTVEEAAK